MTLVDEARRQLDICNACRYCEGYCAVYPALERRIDLTAGDLTQLANLCHDCRACYYACMYAPPHEFMLNPPQLLSEIRRDSYARLVPLSRLAPAARLPLVVGLVSATLLVVIAATKGLSALIAVHPHAASPYMVLPYLALLAIGLTSAAVAVVLFGAGARRYFAEIGPAPAGVSRLAAFVRAGYDAATLKYLRSAGVECTYPSEAPSALRRRLHSALAGGFVFALAATIAASIGQDFLSHPPPYGLWSAPVLLGIFGGAGMLVGGLGLIALKGRADPALGDEGTRRADHGLLAGLVLLGLTGLLSLLTRTTSAYGVVLFVHLDAVFSCFLLAPFTKFAHVVYRFCALVRDEEERATEVL